MKFFEDVAYELNNPSPHTAGKVFSKLVLLVLGYVLATFGIFVLFAVMADQRMPTVVEALLLVFTVRFLFKS